MLAHQLRKVVQRAQLRKDDYSYDPECIFCGAIVQPPIISIKGLEVNFLSAESLFLNIQHLCLYEQRSNKTAS